MWAKSALRAWWFEARDACWRTAKGEKKWPRSRNRPSGMMKRCKQIMSIKNRPDNARAPAVVTAWAKNSFSWAVLSCMQLYAELGPPLYYTTTILFYLN